MNLKCAPLSVFLFRYIHWIILPLLLTLLSDDFAYCQTQDAQVWENIALSKDISRNLKLTFNQEGRISNNVSQFNYTYGDFGFSRKLSKHFKFALDYVFVLKQLETHLSKRHQWYADITFKSKIARNLEINIREMFQQQVQDIYSSERGRYPENLFRSKTTLKYSFPYFPLDRFSPYFAWETYYHIDNNDKYGPGFVRNRYFIGSYYNFNKRTSIELYYLFEKNFNINNAPTNYIYGIGFEREL